MREVNLRELQELLREMPLMVEIHPLSLAFLPEDVQVFQDAWQMIAELDTPSIHPTRPMLTVQVEPAFFHRLPAVQCKHNPLSTELNRVLLKRYDLVKQTLLCQSKIADHIVQGATADAIVVVLIDGLSYADLMKYAPRWANKARPVLVDGVSVTEQGMMRIVGTPPLVNRLFDIGYRIALGFTYWERTEEPLTNRLFTGFGDRVRKVRTFDEVTAELESNEVKGSYVQIVRDGLDSIAHRQREKPNREAIVKDILRDYERLTHLFNEKGVSASVHLISDHGILWADEHEVRVYEYGGADHPRHYEHVKRSENVLNVEFEGKEYAMLNYPYIRRELRANEWGVHGGLSFEESVAVWVSCSVEKETKA